MLGDERGGDLRVAWAGVLEGAGAIAGGWVGIDGFTSFGFRGGVMRVVPDLEPADGFAVPRSAASFSEIAIGELLVPV